MMNHYKLVLVMLSLVVFSTCRTVLTDFLKALFVGNSVTYAYNMLYTFSAIALGKVKKRLVKTQAKRGSARSDHVSAHKLYNLMRNTTWGIVVLQPGAGESGVILYRGPDTEHAGAIGGTSV